jgi:hypothetical protein
LQGFLLQIEVFEIVVAEACEPDAIVDFSDAEALAGEHGRDVDFLAMQADAAAGGDEDVVKRIVAMGQAVVAFGRNDQQEAAGLRLSYLPHNYPDEIAARLQRQVQSF